MGIDSHSKATAASLSGIDRGDAGPDDSPEWAAVEAELRADVAPATEVLRLLGRGSVSRVYLAREVALRRLVAIKVLSPSSEQVTRLRFEREGQAVAAILHPNLIPIFRVDRLPGGVPYLVMPYIKGRSLAERIAARTPFEPAEVRRIITELAGALAAAHRRGIVHRDVKPANVLCEEETGRIYLMDFGLAGVVESGEHADLQLTRAGEVLGDAQYMSPEQAAGRSVTELADVYSLGLLGCELITSGVSDDAVPPSLERVRELGLDRDAQLVDLLARCLQPRPQHRPSAAEVMRLLSTPVHVEQAESVHPAPIATAPVVAPSALPPIADEAPDEGETPSFFHELARRKVFRVAVFYMIYAWAAIQIATSTFPFLQLPDWTVTLVIVFVILGAPIALVLGWMFDITPSGVKRTPPTRD